MRLWIVTIFADSVERKIIKLFCALVVDKPWVLEYDMYVKSSKWESTNEDQVYLSAVWI